MEFNLMSVELYVAFVVAAGLLIAAPGPNVAIIVANSIAHGPRYGLATVAGTSAAMSIQLTGTVLGLAGLFALLAAAFEWLRWIGVAYLLYLGLTALCFRHDNLEAREPKSGTLRRMFVRGFLVALTNPKTLLFYSAFLPQFIDPSLDRTTQLAVLAATFLALAVVLDSAWALLAPAIARLANPRQRTVQRLTGGLLIGAAAGLALARRP